MYIATVSDEDKFSNAEKIITKYWDVMKYEIRIIAMNMGKWEQRLKKNIRGIPLKQTQKK